jgi:DNA-nicking Smr family endonuclease
MASKRDKPIIHGSFGDRVVKRPFHSPFKHLAKLLEERRRSSTRAGDGREILAPHPASESPISDDELLQRALEGVRPINKGRGHKLTAVPRITREVVTEEAEVLALLCDVVSGAAPFEFTETDEYVEGARAGLDPRLLARLRHGEFAMQGHIDLHGLLRDDAKTVLQTFIRDSVRKGRRAVLIVHGRGRGSPGGRPVLKHLVSTWLARGALTRYVLAFATARPVDGGAGALYVLLKRDRQKAVFSVANGGRLSDW